MFCHSLVVICTKQRYIDFLFFHEKVINMNFITKWWRQAMNSKTRIYWSPIFLKITSAYQFWYKTAYSTPFRIQFFPQLTIILRNTFCHCTIKLCYQDITLIITIILSDHYTLYQWNFHYMNLLGYYYIQKSRLKIFYYIFCQYTIDYVT